MGKYSSIPEKPYTSIEIFIKKRVSFLFLMEYYYRFLSRFSDYAFALHFWKHKLAVFCNGANAQGLATQFVKYLHHLPEGQELSYGCYGFRQTATVVPFSIHLRTVTTVDSLDNLLEDVNRQRSNDHPYFLYVLADPTTMLPVGYQGNQKETNLIYRVDIGACIELWQRIEKRKKID